MPNPLRLISSNPAWFRANINRALIEAKNIEEAAQAQRLAQLARKMDTHVEDADPETYFKLIKSMEQRAPSPLDGVQERLQGFDKGGSVLDKKRSWTDDVSDGAFNIVQSGLQALKREGPMAVAGFIPGGRLTIGAQLASDSGEAEASGLQKMLQMFYHGSNQPLKRGAIINELDVSPQRRVAEYFANKRTDQLGGAPQVYGVLVDPFAGTKHGLALPFDRIREDLPNYTQARRLTEADRPIRITTKGQPVEDFKRGGLVSLRKERHCG